MNNTVLSFVIMELLGKVNTAKYLTDISRVGDEDEDESNYGKVMTFIQLRKV